MEVTKIWLKPSGKERHELVTARVCRPQRVNAEQASKMPMRRSTRVAFRGRLIRLWDRANTNTAAVPGYWRQHVHKESARNTGNPMVWSGTTNRTPVTDRPGILG